MVGLGVCGEVGGLSMFPIAGTSPTAAAAPRSNSVDGFAHHPLRLSWCLLLLRDRRGAEAGDGVGAAHGGQTAINRFGSDAKAPAHARPGPSFFASPLPRTQ